MNRDQRRVFNLIVVGTIIVVGTWVGTSLLLPDKSEASWWDDSWRYRQIVTATNNSPFTASDVPYRILMDTATPIASGKMKADGSDIRVVNNRGEVIRFQIEQSTLNTSETGIWFDATIQADNSATYYVYYGNSSAATPSFTSDIASNTSNGTTVTTNDGFEYTTSTSYGRVSDYKKDGTNLGVNGTYRNTDSYPGTWWDDRTFTRTQLASGPMFVEVKFEDTEYGHYSSYGTIVKMFENGFAEEHVYMNYSNTGSEDLYYYLHYDAGTRNSVWIDATESLINQASDSGSLTRASLGHNWFGQRWTDTGNYGGTVISPNTNDWRLGQTSAQNSYYQTNYSTSESYATGSARLIRFGTFAGTGTVSEMHEKASLLGAQSTTLSSEEVGPGPVAYWKFDEGTGTTATDSTNNRNNGTITGATWKSQEDCITGKCLFFTGTNNINTPDPSNNSLDFGTGDFTISVWIKTGISADHRNLIRKGAGNGLSGFRFGLSNGIPNILLGDSSGFAAGNLGTTSIADNRWHHLTVVYDRDGNAIGYVDGMQVGVRAISAYQGSVDNASSVIIGNSYATFTGFLDEVRMYPYARTAEQIKTDYNSGAATVLGAKDANLNNGLVGYWKMDEALWNNTAGEVIDSSGNSNNLIASSAAIATGNFGNGGNFDGTDDYIEWANVPTASKPNIRSKSYWIKPASFNTNYIYSTIAALSGDGLNPDSGYHKRSTAHINTSGQVVITSSSYSCTGANTFLVYGHTSSSALTLNQWHHITEVIDYTNPSITLYIDGKYQGKTSNSDYSCSSDENNWWIGRRKTGNDFNGKMDEFRLYNRALSAAEAQQLYNYAPPPVAYYDFEEKTGVTVKDQSGNGNTGTLNSSPLWSQGKYGGSLHFDTAGDYISTSGIAVGSTWTISTWSKFPLAANGTYRTLARAGGGLHHVLVDSNGLLGTYNASFASSGYDVDNLSPGWHYIAAVGDGGTTTFYIDGTRVGSSAQQLTGNITQIGGIPGTQNWGFIDDFRVYNYARTSGQITEDMNAGHPIGGSPVGSQIGYWKFDEGSGTTANNSGNTPTLTGTLNGATWSNNGKYGKALSFNGSSSVTLSNISPLQTDTKTVSFWANPTSAPTSFQGILYGGLNWYVGVNSNNRVMTSYAKSDGTQSTAYSSNNTLIPNEWHYYAVTMSVSGDNVTIKFYRDGKLINTVNHTTGYGTSYASSFTIGGVGSTYYFSGLLDEVKFYNTALTEEQIKVDYNSGKSLQFGVLGTDASGNPSNSSDRAYCPPGDTTATCGPVAEWKFDERYGTTAKDTSGSTSGTLENSPTWTTGKIGSALDFNGTNQGVSMGDNLDLTSTPLSIAVWVKPRTWASLGGIVTKLSSGGNYRLIMQSNGTVAFGIRAADNTYQQVASTTTLPLNQWSHIVVAYNNSTTAKIYINGKLDAITTTFTVIRGDTTSPLYIGYNANNAAYFDGAIDHVQLYNYIRSEAQIVWDYSRGAPIAHYKFNECQGGTVRASTLPYNSVLDGTINIGSSGTQTSAGTCQTAGSAWGNGASGKFNGSLNFDGTDDYVSIPDSTLLDMDYQTLTAWVKTNGNGADQYISERNNTVFYIRISSSGTLCYYLATVGATWTCTTRTVNDENWHHVAVSWDGTTKKLYIDGILAGSESYAGGTLNASANAINIGVRINSGTPAGYFNGQIDDVQIFNYALTPQQIKTIMTQGAIRFGP